MTGVLRYGASLLVLLCGWKLAALLLGTAMLPPPETAISAFGSAVKTWAFWSHFLASALRVTAAMGLAWLTAFPAGILLGYHGVANRYLSPFVFLTYPVPKIVLLPVFLVLFGLGDLSKIFMIALIIGYQILVATRDSVIGLDPKYIDSFRSLGGMGYRRSGMSSCRRRCPMDSRHCGSAVEPALPFSFSWSPLPPRKDWGISSWIPGGASITGGCSSASSA